uniref:Uncharacterized protein n=1 Tax=Timema tahoe TaxID=61484 RepID=A0A7R9ID28_9NEOP|nr:unnamed protein product [Timema tahoe]
MLPSRENYTMVKKGTDFRKHVALSVMYTTFNGSDGLSFRVTLSFMYPSFNDDTARHVSYVQR